MARVEFALFSSTYLHLNGLWQIDLQNMVKKLKTWQKVLRIPVYTLGISFYLAAIGFIIRYIYLIIKNNIYSGGLFWISIITEAIVGFFLYIFLRNRTRTLWLVIILLGIIILILQSRFSVFNPVLSATAVMLLAVGISIISSLKIIYNAEKN